MRPSEQRDSGCFNDMIAGVDRHLKELKFLAAAQAELHLNELNLLNLGLTCSLVQASLPPCQLTHVFRARQHGSQLLRMHCSVNMLQPRH